MRLARSTYYYQKKNRDKVLEREKLDCDLKDKIDSIHVSFPYYGYRTLHHELERRGIVVNEKKIRRIQRKFGLFAIKIRKFIRTTDSDHDLKIYSNLLKPMPELTDINQAWLSDITYIRINTGFVFLAAIMDLYSRKMVGWALSKRIDRDLTLGALKMALKTRKPGAGCIHHSDRGVQYCCSDYVELLNFWGFQISMSRKGNPYDNAWMESFMKTLKHNEVYLNHYETYLDVLERIPEFIEEVYNKKRLHSSIGYLTPDEFEKRLEKTRRPEPPKLDR